MEIRAISANAAGAWAGFQAVDCEGRTMWIRPLSVVFAAHRARVSDAPASACEYLLSSHLGLEPKPCDKLASRVD